MSQAGFLISPKSVLTPAPSILWLGKFIDPVEGFSNIPTRSACVSRSILSLFTSRCSPRALQRVLGSIQWLACPHSCAAPWLAPVYHHLFSCPSRTLLPPRVLAFLLTSFLFTLPRIRPRRVPPPFVMPQLFIDAAPWGSAFTVACFRPLSFASVVSVPSWIVSLQDAELYGAFHALRQCALRKLSHCCIHTDNLGVYFTLLSGRASSSLPARCRLLRRIFRLCFTHDLHFQISWVPSKWNPADAFSRPNEKTVTQALDAAALLNLTPTCPLPVLSPGWLWFRFSFPSLRDQENAVLV